MINLLFIKFFNLIRFIIYRLIDFIISLYPRKESSEKLLIIRLDSIGDYILIRNFFTSIKESKKYKNYKITLCGNIVWKNLAETFDGDVISDFIWIDRKKFNNNPVYKFRILKQIYLAGFNTVIDTTYTREILFGDSIVRTSKAKYKIGSTGSLDASVKWKRNLITNRNYTRLIDTTDENIFEFYRNKLFIEKVIEEQVLINKPILVCDSIELKLPTDKKYVVVFPGAQESSRIWSAVNFDIVIKQLITNNNLIVILAGSPSDKRFLKAMSFAQSSKHCFDMTGKTDLPRLAKLISQAELLISNETGSIHFAAAVGTKFICISNGQRFGRFMPYPAEMNVNGIYVFPKEIEDRIKDTDYLKEKYRFNSSLDINSIPPEKVINAMDNMSKS